MMINKNKIFLFIKHITLIAFSYVDFFSEIDTTSDTSAFFRPIATLIICPSTRLGNRGEGISIIRYTKAALK